MIIIIEQMALLFLFMCLGYFFGKRKIIDSNHSKLISVLCVNLFMPCTVFRAFYNNFNKNYLTTYSSFILVSAIILFVLIILGYFISNFITDDKYLRGVYRYSFIVSNYGYMGYALVQALFGDDMLLNMVLFGISSGGAIFIAQFWGKKENSGIWKMEGVMFSFSMVIALIFTFASVFFPKFFNCFYSIFYFFSSFDNDWFNSLLC